MKPHTREYEVMEKAALAAQLAPALVSGLDFSGRPPAFGNPSDPSHYEVLADRCFLAAEAFFVKREALLIAARAKDEVDRAKSEAAANG